MSLVLRISTPQTRALPAIRGCALSLALSLVCSVAVLAQDNGRIIIVKSNVSGADVYVDGVRKGITAGDGGLAVPGLAPGLHRVLVEKQGFLSAADTVRITDTLDGSVELRLRPVSESASTPPASDARRQPPPNPVRSSPPPKKAKLLIDINMEGVEVQLNGLPRGRTDENARLELEVAPGPHHLLLTKDGYAPVSVSVEVGPGGLVYRGDMAVSSPPSDRVPSRQRGGPSLPVVIAFLLVLGMLVVGVAFVLVTRNSNKLRFGDYLIEEVIGRGGMSTVYRAWTPGRTRLCALKVMDTGLLGDGDLVDKFLREGEILQRIYEKSPYAPVVRVMKYGRGPGTGIPFIAMEFLPGSTLSDVLKRDGRIPLRAALGIVRQVAGGVKAAHEVGVLHRDIKPDNVMVVVGEPQWEVRLIDFGVARDEDTSGRTIGILGTPTYMAPEQFGEGEVTDKADVYSLGIMLYALIAGETPFKSSNPVSVMEMHRKGIPPPLPDHLPDELRQFAMELLAKNSADRPPMAAVLRRLRQLDAMIFRTQT